VQFSILIVKAGFNKKKPNRKKSDLQNLNNKIKYSFLVSLFLSCTASFGQSQGELNEAAGKQYRSADSTLNSIYKLILNRYYSDTTFTKNLKATQQLWITFRDAELKMKFPENYSFGSVQPMCVSLYLADLTNNRIQSLRNWIYDIEEGDVCAGSVRLAFADTNCQLANPDTSVFGINLLDRNSSMKQVGLMSITHEAANDLPHLSFCTKEKTQTLTLFIHPGGVVNEVAEFQVKNYSESDSALSLETNSFITSNGIVLGMSKSKVTSIFGHCYKTSTTKSNREVIKYHINGFNNSEFLKRFEYPVYYAEYEFEAKKLVRLRFGVEYP
jgi:uncharacterized protein YecT (DUF1311 family)